MAKEEAEFSKEQVLLHLASIQARLIRDKNVEIVELRKTLHWLEQRLGKLEDYIVVGVAENVSSVSSTAHERPKAPQRG